MEEDENVYGRILIVVMNVNKSFKSSLDVYSSYVFCFAGAKNLPVGPCCPPPPRGYLKN